MNYYIFIEDEIIIGRGQCKQLTEGVLNIEVAEGVYNNIEKYIYEDGELTLNTNYESELAEARKAEFLSQFFEIPEYGFFRKQPKGYSSAVESLNTAFNIVSIIGNLPAGTLTFYEMPDFTIEEQCTEEWLVANSYKNDEMTATEFGKFYADFMTAWNTQEHQ